MPVAKTLSYTLVAEDRDSIAQSQTTAGAGNLTLNGANASGFTGGGYQLSLYSSGNLSAQTITITGLDENGDSLVISQAGPNAGTEEVVNSASAAVYFSSVTSIATDGALGTAIEVGHVDEFASKMYPTDRYVANTSFLVELSGTAQFDVQSIVQNPQTTTNTDLVWLDHTSVVNKTANASGTYVSPIAALRVITDSFTSTPTIKFHILQEGPY